MIHEASKPYVHHILVYLCDTLDGVTLDQGGPCDSVDRRIANCRSGQPLGGWAVGGVVINIFDVFKLQFIILTVFCSGIYLS